MGEPKFDRSKRYVDKKGRKFGKGVWLGYNRVIQPGWGDFNRDNRTVTQYNTDGTKTVFSWEQWQNKKTKDHELKVLQNDRKYAIPFIPSKKMAITIDKDSPTRKNAGVVISENLLDSIAVNASKARLPFSTALGMAAQESTLGNSSSRTVGKTMLPWLYVLSNSKGSQKNAAKAIPYNNVQSPSLLISNWKRIYENPFAAYHYDGQGDLLKEKRDKDYYNDYFNSDLRKSNKYEMKDTSPLFHGFRSYKKDPYNYNPGDTDYPNKVEAQRKELVNYSPEIKAYMKKHNLKADGGELDTDYSYIDADNRRSNVLLHNDNGLLVDSNGNNYTQSYLEENNVPIILGKMPRDTSPYFDPFGALTFANAAAAPITSLSPSNVVGSIRKAHDYTSFMDSFMNQDNSGFFTDAYAQEHPYISALGNLAGDIAIGAIGDKALDAVRNLPNVPAYRKLGYKANKLQKRLGLIDRSKINGKYKSTNYYTLYGEHYPEETFFTAFERNPQKYGSYENLYSKGEARELHDYFKKHGFKTPYTYKEGDTYYIMQPGDREYKLFSDNPEYYQFIEETGLPALDQSTVDKFLERQGTSLRGVYASNERDARRFLTETEYGKVRGGGDRLHTNGGLYTSNSKGIAEAFKNPNSNRTVDGYIGKLQMRDDIDRTLPIEQQLSQMRNKVFSTNDSMVGNSWTLDSRMRKKAIDNGAVAFESKYGRRNGTTLPVVERAYLPTKENNGINHPVTIKDLEYYPNQENQAGRWNTAGVDYVPEDNELFIPKQLNSTTDYIKYMREMLSKDWIPDEMLSTEYQRDAYHNAQKRIGQYVGLRKQASDAYHNVLNRVDTAKKIGTGLGVMSPLGVTIYALAHDNERENNNLRSRLDNVYDYYLHNGNNDQSTEESVKRDLDYLKDHYPKEYEHLMNRINKKNNSHSDGGYLNNDWDSLSYKDKAEMMKVAIANGITTLPEIREAYNKFAKGGKMNGWTIQDEAGYKYWRSRLPRNLRETNDANYDMRAAYKAGMQPEWNDADKSYHLGSRDPQSGKILKAPHHPTYLKALMEDARLGYYPTMDTSGNTYTETWKGNRVYSKGGYMPSAKIKKDIATWEGSSMKTNRSFEAEARDFNSAIPSSVRDKLSSSQLDALFSYGYNVGMSKLKERVLPVLTAYAQGKATREDVQKSMWATKDSQFRGLNNRRNWERSLFGGNYKTSFGDGSVGSHIDPTRFQIDDNFFNDISSQINSIELPQVQLPESMDVDPSTLYKAPIIDDTLLTMPKPVRQESPYKPRQEALERMQGINNLMGMLGMNSPFKGLPGIDTSSPGLMSYVNAIYS